MVCKICGTELGDDELQCPMCGEPVTSEPEKEEDIVSEEEITESMIESFGELGESKKKGLFSRKKESTKTEGEEVSSDKPRKQKFTIRITKKTLIITGAMVIIAALAIIIALGIHFGLFGTFGKFPKTL